MENSNKCSWRKVGDGLYSTGCGVTTVSVFKKEWKKCPFCGAPIGLDATKTASVKYGKVEL